MATVDDVAPVAVETLPAGEDVPARGGNRGARKATLRLRRRRRELDLTLRELASETGLSIGFLSQLERHEIGARGPTRAKLAQRLGRPESGLFEPPTEVVELTQAQAAAMLGKSPKYVRALCARDEFPHRREGHELRIERAAIEALGAVEWELELEWWVLADAERKTGLEWWVLRKAIAEVQLEVRRVDGRCYVRQSDARELAARLLADVGPCPVCGGRLDLGRKLHQRCAGIVQGAKMGEWWSSPAGEERKAKMAATAAGKVNVPCFICRGDVELWPHEVRERSENKRRTFCSACDAHRDRYLMRARHVAASARTGKVSTKDAWTQILSIGQEFEEAVLPQWQSMHPRGGRHRALAEDLAIEAMFAWADFSRSQIQELCGYVNDEYVKTRLKLAGIRRRAA